MTYNPKGNNHQKEAYTQGYTDAEYLGKNWNQYSIVSQPNLYEAYEDGFNDWFDYVNDDEYSYRRVQTTLKVWCTG